jgi:hypothetical protein
MFNDVKISNDQFNPNYKQWIEDKKKQTECQMSVTVLNESHWPTSNKITLNPSAEFALNMKNFEEFYGCAAQKKLLYWIFQSGDAEVNYTFVPKAGAKPLTMELVISSTQACICLLFNQNKQMRFKDILTALGTSEEHLKYSLTSIMFTKERFIANKGTDGKVQKKEVDENGKMLAVTWDSIDPEDYLEPCKLNSQKRRNIFQHIKQLPPGKGPGPGSNPNAPGSTATGGDDGGASVQQVIKERELKMQLALVRVMKMRNKLQVQQLIAEASEQLAKYFTAEPKLMRKQIEVLMERGFMKRDDDDQRIMHYVA